MPGGVGFALPGAAGQLDRWQCGKRSASYLRCVILEPAFRSISMLAPEVIDCAKRAVLCWLATVDADGVPNVSPKEVWATIGDRHVVVANIASPVSVRNIAANAAVCVSFVDVFVQKGFKVKGRASVVRPGDAEYGRWAAPLEEMTGGGGFRSGR
jgi:predicted pyridoxine 5'-phosphate oxidase superfamily flavin-nucleotide-binding protein